MKLVTVRVDGGHRAGRVDDDVVTLLDFDDVGALLAAGRIDAARSASGPTVAYADCDLAPVVPNPDKIVCVGLNYADHVAETGRDTPSHPTYFAKYRRALIGPNDPIVLPDPAISAEVDWEGELAIVIGRSVRLAGDREAAAAIVGFTVVNDVSMRDWQMRTSQFLAGKTFEGSTPVGPCLVTTDEIGDGLGLDITTELSGVVKQSSNTRELVFSPIDIVVDLSKVMTLDPGDIIATGTPSGVGRARTPPEFMAAGDTLVTTVAGIGELRNEILAPRSA
jgi:acylpyruvate hydrolase